MKKVSHVIFDMDGLLLDTEHIYESAVREIAKSYNTVYSNDVRMKVMGTTEQMTIKIVIEELKLPLSEDEFITRFDDFCRHQFEKLDLLKGADRLVHHLHKVNVPFCLATSSSQEMAELKMVPDKIVQPERRKEATLVLNSLDEFQPEMFGLPPF